MSQSFEEFRKERKKKETSGATIAGAGATAAGVGAIAGGVPGKEADLSRINFGKPKNAKDLVRSKAEVGRQMGRSGILGFRSKVHQGGLYGFNQAKTKDEWSGPAKDAKTAFKHGRNAGKIDPEVRVLRHMAGGRKASNAVALGGAGAVAYGLGKEKKTVKKAWSEKKKGEALQGAGASGAAISAGGGALLSSQKRKWAKEASRNIDDAGKIAPNTAGRRKGRTPGRRTMDPSVTDGAIVRNKLLNGVNVEGARKVGELRGNAAQARHFSHVYGNAGKVVALGGGAASVAAYRAGKKKVEKSADPFNVTKARAMSDAELRRRKKAQGAISRTTATLGLTGLGLLGAAKATGSKPGFLKPVAKPITRAMNRANMTTEQIKGAAQNTSVVAGGIGGAGGYNFASYTSAEAKKRGPRQPPKNSVKKNWTPSTNQYDPEKNRAKRAGHYETASSAAAIGAGGAAVGYTVRSQKEAGRADRANDALDAARKGKKNLQGLKTQVKFHEKKAKLMGRKATKATGIAVGASAAGLGVDQWRKREFGKSEGTSAFGVVHD